MSGPPHSVAAVTHPDPYPYYAGLVAQRPLHRDEGLGFWVAAGAAAVRATLTSGLARVRPAAEPVPQALVGTAAGEIFRQLVRMNDGAAHLRLKPGVSARLATLDPAGVSARAAASARRLADELEPAAHPERLADFGFRLPVDVVGGLLGVAQEALAATAAWTGDFVGCLAPGCTPAQLERGTAAAAELARLVGRLLGRPELDAQVANTVGYLSQAYEATAGLIGNTLVALGRHPEVRARLDAGGGGLGAVVREVVRHDAPVQNTRRFLAADGVVGGEAMREGDVVLVVLAAANRDPAVNADPERFDPLRRERQAFTFGLGAHACPGEALATAIAEAGVRRLLDSGVEPLALIERVAYRASANTRIPLFAPAAGAR